MYNLECSLFFFEVIITIVFYDREIYKCVMCRTVFTQKSLLSVHIDTHLAKQKMNVFKCPDCNKLFTQRGSLLEHFKVCFLFSSTKISSVQ